MIAAMMQRVPDWQPSSEADLDQVLLDLFSAAADELSDYQDRVMNEAYLASARKRVSLARHARLMDYHIHQGNQASTWLAARSGARQPLRAAGRRDATVLPVGHAQGLGGNARNRTPRRSSFTPGSGAVSRVHQLVNRMAPLHVERGDPVARGRRHDRRLTSFTALLPPGVPAPLTDQASALAVQTLIRSGVITRLLIQEHLNPRNRHRQRRQPAAAAAAAAAARQRRRRGDVRSDDRSARRRPRGSSASAGAQRTSSITRTASPSTARASASWTTCRSFTATWSK